MNTFICLLRGINVSGQKMIKMADLKVSFENCGFTDVITYIQSGNIVFRSSAKNSKDLEKVIGKMLQDDYGFEVTVIVLTPDEMKVAATNNPFEKDGEKDPEKCYVVFLQEAPKPENIEVLTKYDYAPEAFVIQNRIIYFYAANGMGNAKMNNNSFENKLKVKASSRNWNTVCKILELAGN
ncbi:MAG: DUF1697 domain-containing protein [Flavobacteriaceae bacterium]|nr:DUF1697 domain-containing protein [Flavobacteriaceae bacterium]